MQDLSEGKCEVCRAGSPMVTEEEMAELLPQVPEWGIVEQQGVRRLERVFKFRDFADALEFTRKVGALAEAGGHHPRIITEWGRVKVTWWTQKIRGLQTVLPGLRAVDIRNLDLVREFADFSSHAERLPDYTDTIAGLREQIRSFHETYI